MRNRSPTELTEKGRTMNNPEGWIASIHDAYERARPEAWQGQLPSWESLTSAQREALILGYSQGRMDALNDFEAASKR